MSRLDLEERKIKRCLKTSLRTEVSNCLSVIQGKLHLTVLSRYFHIFFGWTSFLDHGYAVLF